MNRWKDDQSREKGFARAVISVLEPAELFVHHDALIVDISPHGFGVRVDRRLLAGTEIVVSVRSLVMLGTVRHCQRLAPREFTIGALITHVLAGAAEPSGKQLANAELKILSVAIP